MRLDARGCVAVRPVDKDVLCMALTQVIPLLPGEYPEIQVVKGLNMLLDSLILLVFFCHGFSVLLFL